MTGIQAIGKFTYQKPGSLNEALRLLKSGGGHARVLAGGTDLVLQIRQGLAHPRVVIDVKGIPDLNQLEYRPETGLHIGASVSLSKLSGAVIVRERFPILAEACSVIGSMQIRNRGTIGGNICNAAPSADSAPALLCLGAIAVLASASSTRRLPLQEFFLGPGKTVIGADELLVRLEIPNPPAHSAGCYMRHTLREEMDIAVVGVGALVTASRGSGRLEEARIALGAVAPTPVRARGAEAVLAGKEPTVNLLEEAAEKAAEEANPVSDIRASAEYRRELVKVLTRRALRKACEKLGVTVRS